VVTDARDGLVFFAGNHTYDRDGVRRDTTNILGSMAIARALDQFVRWPESSLEAASDWNSYAFSRTVSDVRAETPFDTVGVDTEEDVRRVEEILKNDL